MTHLPKIDRKIYITFPVSTQWFTLISEKRLFNWNALNQ